jgi:hypothetical protein
MKHVALLRELLGMRALNSPSRRMGAVCCVLVASAWLPTAFAGSAGGLTLDSFRNAQALVVSGEKGGTSQNLKVITEWNGAFCRPRLVNQGKVAVRVKEVILFDLAHSYPGTTPLYGEGFTMPSQTMGTLAKPVDTGLTDRKHYKIPQPEDATVLYGLFT